MTGPVKALIAAVLALPPAAFLVGALASPEDPQRDRSRPVIIGQVDDPQPGPTLRPRPVEDRDDDGDRRDDRGDDAGDDGDDGPAVVIPPPREPDGAGDDDGVGDDDDDDDDEDESDDDGDDDGDD